MRTLRTLLEGWLRAVLIALLSAATAWAQGANGRPPDSIVQAHLLPGETADVKIKNAIAALAGGGGVIEARGLSGTQTIAHTVVIPANTTVLLHPNVVYICTVANAPCWVLTGNGSRLLGAFAGANDVKSQSQTGTVLRMGAGVTSTTDMIAVNPDLVSAVAGIEVGGMTIDFASPTSTVGRHGLAVYGMNRSWIHDVTILNPGTDGFHAETGPGVHSYEVIMDRVYVRSAQRDGFRWDTSTNPRNLDLDKWIINDIHYVGFNLGTTISAGINCPASGGRFGSNGISVVAGASAVTQSILDFEFNNIFVATTKCGGNGVLIDAPSARGGPINRIHISGEIEDDIGVNSGTGIKIISASIPDSNGKGCSNNCAMSVQQLTIDFITANWNTVTNVSHDTVTGYTYRQDGLHLLRTDGLQIVPGVLPDAATYNPTGGALTWQSQKNGTYLWYLTSDGIIHIARTDINTPTDYFLLDQGNNRFGPGADHTGSLGWVGKRWGNIDAYTMMLGGQSNTWTSGSGVPGGSCATGSIYSNSAATSPSTVLYVCYPANAWKAVMVP